MRDARHLDHVARSLLRPAVAGKLGFSAGRSTGRSGGTFLLYSCTRSGVLSQLHAGLPSLPSRRSLLGGLPLQLNCQRSSLEMTVTCDPSWQ